MQLGARRFGTSDDPTRLTDASFFGIFVGLCGGDDVLDGESRRVKERTSFSAAPIDKSGHDLTEVAQDRAGLEDSLGERHIDFAAMRGLMHVIDDDAKAIEDARVELAFSRRVGSDRVDMRMREKLIRLDEGRA